MDKEKDKKPYNKKFIDINFIKSKVLNIKKYFSIKNYYFIINLYKKHIREFRKNKKNDNGIITKSIIAIMSSFAVFIFIMLLFKIILLEKYNNNDNSYDNFNSHQQVNIKEDTKENEINNVVINRISNDALDEELEAQKSFKQLSYSFNVDRKITTKEKIHLFNSANWEDIDKIISENTKLEVNLMVSPGGYMMYQISNGDYKGKFITANENLLDVEVNDNIDTELIKKNIAIKILKNVNSYSDKNIKKIKAEVYKNVVLNIRGYGVYNNRLVYLITDGTFVPVDPTSIIETAREEKKDSKTENKKKKTKRN